MADESILGLLLRAHAEVAAQKHGERYVFHFPASSMDYDTAQQHIESAINAAWCADMTHQRLETEKRVRTEIAAAQENERQRQEQEAIDAAFTNNA